MAWIYLLIAGGCEITWAVALKYSVGFSRPVPSVITVLVGLLSLFFLSLATRQIPLGTAYAIWTGIGAVGAVAAGAILFGEPVGLGRGFFILLIAAGIVGLKLMDAPVRV